jgi:hypothetical protein
LTPFQSLGPNNTQNAVKGLMKNPGNENIELRRKIQALSDQSGQDFTGDINSRRIAQQFQKSNTNGSRNAVMFGGLGAAFGSIAGPMGAGVGLTAGTQLGGVVDKFGPQMAQGALDGALHVKKAAAYLMSMPRFAEMSQSNPAAFQTAVQQFAARIESGAQKMPAAAANSEMDKNSSSSSQYKSSTMPEPPAQSQQKFLEGN